MFIPMLSLQGCISAGPGEQVCSWPPLHLLEKEKVLSQVIGTQNTQHRQMLLRVLCLSQVLTPGNRKQYMPGRATWITLESRVNEWAVGRGFAAAWDGCPFSLEELRLTHLGITMGQKELRPSDGE
jgi:hypothetical protein